MVEELKLNKMERREGCSALKVKHRTGIFDDPSQTVSQEIAVAKAMGCGDEEMGFDVDDWKRVKVKKTKEIRELLYGED